MTRQVLSLEVTRQRPVTQLVVLERDVAVGGEGTGEDADVAEDGLEGLVEDVCVRTATWRATVSKSSDGEKGSDGKRARDALEILYSKF